MPIGIATLALLLAAGCSSLPSTHYERYSFPSGAYVGDVKNKPYTVLGQVRAREDYVSLDQEHDDDELCKNYYNKGVRDLVKEATAKGADAVIGVKSVTFNADGTVQTYDTPQCADDGQAGQVLLQGVAVNWGKAPPKVVALARPSSQRFRGLRLHKGGDGMDGGIRIMRRTRNEPLEAVLYTMDRKVLDETPVGSPKAWLTAEFLRSPKDRVILLNSSENGVVSTKLFTLGEGKLSLLQAEDSVTRKTEPLLLIRGPEMDWRLTQTEPRDLLMITERSPGTVEYTRYHFDLQGAWVKFTSTAPGDWDSSKPFPPEDRFPAMSYGADHSPK